MELFDDIELVLTLSAEDSVKVQEAARERGLSINDFICVAIREKIERLNQSKSTSSAKGPRG